MTISDDVIKEMIETAAAYIGSSDPSHDINHTLRVLANAKKIGLEEKGDLDVIIPAAIFHDVINYPKNDPKASLSSEESAALASKYLNGLVGFPADKISRVESAIRACSFSKGIIPSELEAKILQDADRLEATGAISIMRTFASSGQMKRQFYDISDPFCQNRNPDDMKFGIDLFYTRLLKVAELMHTATAKEIAHRRTAFLYNFIEELKLELNESAS